MSFLSLYMGYGKSSDMYNSKWNVCACVPCTVFELTVVYKSWRCHVCLSFGVQLCKGKHPLCMKQPLYRLLDVMTAHDYWWSLSVDFEAHAAAHWSQHPRTRVGNTSDDWKPKKAWCFTTVSFFMWQLMKLQSKFLCLLTWTGLCNSFFL